MPKDKKPLEPSDFPVNADGKEIKNRTAHLLQKRMGRLSQPISLSVSTTMKLGAKKINGQRSSGLVVTRSKCVRSFRAS